ncbi:probable NADP-dependent mannitol dehydrogenase [Diutina catenulata]
MSLSGKTIVITGGCKNLGALCATDLAQLGKPNFVLHYHSDSLKSDADKLVAELDSKYGSKAIAVQGNLEDVKEITKLFETAKKEFGGVDIAINTVGMVLKKPIMELSEKEYDHMFDVNSKVAFFFIKEAGNHLNKGGKICTIVTSLLAAFTGYYALYAGSKAPVEHFCRAAAKEFVDKGISVTNVAPGPMDTPFFYGQESDEAVAFHKSQSLNGKLTDIKDIAPIVRFLVTEGWWITGQTIFANGGYTTR